MKYVIGVIDHGYQDLIGKRGISIDIVSLVSLFLTNFVLSPKKVIVVQATAARKVVNITIKRRRLILARAIERKLDIGHIKTNILRTTSY